MHHTSRASIQIRSLPARSAHPPYGLYVDPHGGRHAWSAVDLRIILGILSTFACVATAFNLVVR